MSREPETSAAKPACYAFLDFRLEAAQGLLFQGTAEIGLRPKSFDTLRCLVENRGRLVTRLELMQDVWGDVTVTDESITKCIADIRKALGDESQEIVRTVKGRGFLFQPEVRIIDHAGAAPEFTQDAVVLAAPVASTLANRRWIWSAAVILVLAVVAAYWYSTRRGRAPGVRSVVVLPFVNISGDPNEEYLSDGITEETTDALARVSELRVVARTSAFQFKDKAQDIRKIGQQVGADAVLEGSVRRAGDKLRVTAQLDSVRDGYHLWSRTWERQMKDVFAVEREIAQGVAQTVQRSVKGLPAGRSEPKSLEAYNLYLRGEYAWRQRDLPRAIHFFESAMALDPEFAPAYAKAAIVHFFTVINMQRRSSDVYPKVRELARKALTLDDSLAEAHIANNLTYLMYGDHQQIMLAADEKGLLRAIELDPSLPVAHAAYAQYLTIVGRKAESFHEFEVAMQLDPLALDLASDAATNDVNNHEFERAIRSAKAVLEVDPHYLPALFSLEQTYEQAGMVVDALVLQERNGIHPAPMIASKRAAFDRHGARGYWQAAAESFAPGGEPKNPFTSILVAIYYGHLRDTELCLKWMERAYADRHPGLIFMKRNPAFDFLHGNARFEAIATKIGLP